MIEAFIFLGLVSSLLSVLFGLAIWHLGEELIIDGKSFVLWPFYSAFGIFALTSIVAWFTGFEMWQWGVLFFAFLSAFPGILFGAQMAHVKQKDIQALGLLDNLEEINSAKSNSV